MGLRLMNIRMRMSLKDCMRMGRGVDLESIHGQVGTHMNVTIEMAMNMDL